MDGTLAWPAAAEAARPPTDQPPLAVSHSELIASLHALKDAQVVWVGTLFNATDAVPAESVLGFDLAKRLDAFTKAVQLCLEC